MDDLPAPAAPRGLKSLGLGAALAAIGVVAAGTLMRRGQGDAAQHVATAQARPTVRLIVPGAGNSTPTLVQPGTIAAWTEARIFARVPGYIRNWQADIGDRVPTGGVLGRIDTPDLDQQIIEAEAALRRTRTEAELARTTARRWQDLLASTAVSRQEADEKTADAATRAAAVAEAAARLGRLRALKVYATVRAPFAGVVTVRNADIGDLVGPGATTQQPLFTLADDHALRIYVDVPQRYAPQMQPGLQATLAVPAFPGRSFAASILGQSGGVDARTGSLRVELVAANPQHDLKPGGYAEVTFRLAPAPHQVTIPASALILRGGTQVATVDRTGHVRLIPVVIGRDLGPTVELSAGLAPGTPIIDSPPDSLQAGDAVTVAGHG